MTVKRIASSYADRSGGDGFYDIKRSTNCCCRIFWIILFLVAWCLVVMQVVSHVQKYLTYPVSTAVEVQFERNTEFPAVTICNLNPVRDSFKDMLFSAGMQQQLIKPPKSGATGTYDSTQIDKFKKDGWDSTSSSGPAHTEEAEFKDSFYAEYYKAADNVKYFTGHWIEDMLIECTFRQAQCYPTDFTHFFHPTLGNCYTFNAGFKKTIKLTPKSNPPPPAPPPAPTMTSTITTKPVQTVSLPGPSNGLSLIMMVGEEDYMPMLVSSTGLRVHLHHYTALPQPQDSGFTISPGFYTALEVKKLTVERLAMPYGNEDCSTTFRKHEDSIKSIWPVANYTSFTCKKLCYQEFLEKKCSCQDPEILYGTNKPTACLLTDSTQDECVAEVMTSAITANSAMSKQCALDCPQGCREIDYESQISSSLWPNRYYLEIMNQTLSGRNSVLKSMMKEEGASASIKENVLKLDVYFQTLNYKSISQSVGYTITEMLSDLGGAVDFWVGMSILAMIAFVEFIYELMAWICCKKIALDDSNEVKPGIQTKMDSKVAQGELDVINEKNDAFGSVWTAT